MTLTATVTSESAGLTGTIAATLWTAGPEAAAAAPLEDFAGQAGTSAIADGRVLLGLGRARDTTSARVAGMALGRRLPRLRAVAVDLCGYEPAEQPRLAGALAEGAVLGAYTWDGPARDARLVLVVDDAVESETQERVQRGVIHGEATCRARRLIDTPPSDLTPADLAAAAAALGRDAGWEVRTLHGDDLIAAGFPAIAAVARGSSRSACLIDVEYRGRPEGPTDVVLVGKGITIDCGGLNLKTERRVAAIMKCDMSGGAAALACLDAVTRLELPLNVRVLVPAAENLPGPDATRPGDVIVHRGGRRSEVTNTDAEGRLILADCLVFAREIAPEGVVIDVATLSDGPFGPVGWTVATRSGRLGERLCASAADTGEVGVPVRLVDGLQEMISSNVADAKNFSYDHVSSDLLVSAAFLEPFAGDGPWAHIDIVGTAYRFGPSGVWPAGATGSPTRALISFLEGWAVSPEVLG